MHCLIHAFNMKHYSSQKWAFTLLIQHILNGVPRTSLHWQFYFSRPSGKSCNIHPHFMHMDFCLKRSGNWIRFLISSVPFVQLWTWVIFLHHPGGGGKYPPSQLLTTPPSPPIFFCILIFFHVFNVSLRYAHVYTPLTFFYTPQISNS